jgi:hypothetical protein
MKDPSSALIFSPGAAGPALAAESPHWTDLARCREVGPDAFFPEAGDAAWLAKQVCAGCEFWVRAECLAQALRRGEWGIWGGTDEQERAALRLASPDQIRTALHHVGKQTCAKCHEDKPFSAFEATRDGDGYEYLRKACRPCHNGRGRECQELETAA